MSFLKALVSQLAREFGCGAPKAALGPCPICGRRLPLNLGFTELTWRKVGLGLLIPVLVYLAMTALLRCPATGPLLALFRLEYP